MATKTDTTQNKQSVFNKSRTDKFILVLTLPNILRDKNTPLLSNRAAELIQLESLQYSVWGSPIPATTIPAQSMGIYGQTYKVTSQNKEPYGPVTVNFTIDNRFNNFWLLWKWLEVLNHPQDSGMPAHFNQFKEGDIKIPAEAARDKAHAMARSLQGSAKERGTQGISEADFKQISMTNNFLDYQAIISVFGMDEYNQKVVEFRYTNAFITHLGEILYNYRDPTEMESSFQFEFSQLDVILLEENISN